MVNEPTVAELMEKGGKPVTLKDKEFILLLDHAAVCELERVTGLSMFDFSNPMAVVKLHVVVDILHCGFAHYKNEHGFPRFTREAVMNLLPKKLGGKKMLDLLAEIGGVIQSVFGVDIDDPLAEKQSEEPILTKATKKATPESKVGKNTETTTSMK